jgi:aromatic-amino-acid transaminase
MAHLIPTHQGRPVDDPIFALNGEAKARAARGESVINATIGAAMTDDGQLAVMPTVMRTLRELDDLSIAAYAPIAGTPPFLTALMDDLFTKPEVRAQAIAVATPGGTGALKQAIVNFLEPGHALLTTNFFWSPYQTIADEAGRSVATFSMFNQAGQFDTQSFERELFGLIEKQGRALIFMNDPCHNPTGYTMTDDDWSNVMAVLESAAAKGKVTLLVDTAYMAYSPRDIRITLERLATLSDRIGILVAWSASKTYTAYGLRVGAILALSPDPATRKSLEAAFAYTSRGSWSNCNHSGLAAIGKLMRDPALRSACDADRTAITGNLFKRVETFNQLAQGTLNYPRYEGGFFVTVFHSDAHGKAEAMKRDGVFVVPQKGAIRVALCAVANADIARLVTSLKG